MSLVPNAFAGRWVLVADDDEHTRQLLHDLCESAGFQVLTAEDGLQALDQVNSKHPDLVLLDLMMPGRDGFSVLKALREKTETAELPVILLTAAGDIDGKIKGMELGADDYITKPFKLVELQTRIAAALTVREYRKRLQHAEDELAQFRTVDPLTGAGTYAQLKASLDAEVARSRRYGRPASALVFGFDDYEKLRYELGRDATDSYLKSVAHVVQDGLRGADRLFRIDSEQFVVILPETDFAGARVAALRLQSAATAVPAVGPSGRFETQVRFGGGVFPSEGIRSSEDLLRAAHRSYQVLQERRHALVFNIT